MPPKHVHATHSILAFGRPYIDLHHEKDAPSRVLGSKHRSVNHDWYQAGVAGMWTLDQPFPEWMRGVAAQIANESGGCEAEEYEVWLSHDYLDFVWDGLDARARRLEEALCCFLVIHPAYILDIAQVDVVSGRIHRLIDGQDVWEIEPDLIIEYRRLRRYVGAVLKNDSGLRELVDATVGY